MNLRWMKLRRRSPVPLYSSMTVFGEDAAFRRLEHRARITFSRSAFSALTVLGVVTWLHFSEFGLSLYWLMLAAVPLLVGCTIVLVRHRRAFL